MTLRDRRHRLSSLEADGHGINEVRRSQKERYPRLLQPARRSPDAKDPFQLLSHDDSRGSPSERQVPIEEESRHHNHNPSKRLTSISSFGPRSSTTKDIERAKPRNAKSAREIIREDVVVGSRNKIRNFEPEEEDKSSGDCSLPSRSAPPPPPSAPSPHKAASSLSTSNRAMFLKPAGVDEPSDSVSRGDGSRPARPEPDTTRGTRRLNLKRDRDDRRRDDAGAQTTKGKRRKSGAAAAA